VGAAPFHVTTSTLRLGQALFRLRSLTPVPVLAVCAVLLWRSRGVPGPGGAGVDAALDALGVALAVAGQALRFFTLGRVPEGTSGQDLHLTASTLNTRGPYAHVRNPLYVGNLGITLGLLCLAHDGWVYALGLGFFFFEYFFIIRAEENYLREKFGAAFDDFCSRVPRWVPRLTPATEGTLRGGGFDWKRALKKEVNPFSAWMTGVVGLWAWEWWARGTLSQVRLSALGALEAAVLLTLLTVKAWKKGWILRGA
jgi:protein-S-isoprenylcysteine O-methyltransferase Ste14